LPLVAELTGTQESIIGGLKKIEECWVEKGMLSYKR
jgi:hypothetical protein